MERYELLKNTLDKCEIILEEDIISKENILIAVKNFLLDSCMEKKHTSSFLLHTGSICYDAVVFCVAIFANLLLDENDAVEDIGSLEKGTKVTYKKMMWYFEGLYDGDEQSLKGRYVLKNEQGNGYQYIPEKALSELVPYNGQAKGLSGKGIRKNTSKRVEFLKEIVGLSQNEIVAVPMGTGDRSERIRTYNFPQGRVSDHRINLTLYKIDAIMNGDLDELAEALISFDQAEKLAAEHE